MKNAVMASFIFAALTVATSAVAQDTSSGTMTVTGTVVSSIKLTIDSAGGSFSGGGTDTATSALDSISKFGALPTAFTRTTTPTTWTLSSNIGVTVVKANSISTAYTLNAKLATAPATSVIWSVHAKVLNAATVTALTAAGAWGSTPTYVWSIEIPDSLPSGSAIDNVIQFSAISG
jgi:hypothetical protein